MSSSSSSCSANCSAELILVPLGCCGCGIEVSNNIAYSVGCQYITYSSFVDECDCILDILINGFIPPVYVEDGEPITIELEIKESCTLCTETIFCDCSNSFAYSLVKRNNKIFLRLKGNNVKNLLKK